MQNNSAFPYADYQQFYAGGLNQPKVSDAIKQDLSVDEYQLIRQVGLPTKIVDQNYIYDECKKSDNHIILASREETPYWTLAIDTDNRAIYELVLWQVAPHKGFYNSSLAQFLLTLYQFEQLKQQKGYPLAGFSSYALFYQFWDDFIKDFKPMLVAVDEQAAIEGYWADFIESIENRIL